MASVSIDVSTGNGDYRVHLDLHETMREAFGSDKSRLDRLLDEAVAKMKRAYASEASSE